MERGFRKMRITIITVASKAPGTELRALSGALFCTTPSNPSVKSEAAKLTQASHRERMGLDVHWCPQHQGTLE